VVLSAEPDSFLRDVNHNNTTQAKIPAKVIQAM
jgi:hypothetical protein